MDAMSKILRRRHPLLETRKSTLQHAWLTDDYAILPIRKISQSHYQGLVLNITVPNTQTYVAKNFLVHNCDAYLFKGKKVVVVGGSDSAAKEALLLSELCSQVTILARSTLHPEPINGLRLKQKKNVKVREGVEIKEIFGKNFVEGVVLKNGEKIVCDGVFVEVGHLAMTELAQKLGVKLNPKGEIMIDRYSKTNVPGLFGAGDCTDTEWKQGIVSAGEGAHAANSAFEYLTENGLVE